MSPEPVVIAYVGLGANLGDCEAALRHAVQAIVKLPSTTLEGVSSLYGSAPVDAQGPDYLNAVVQLRTGLSAPALLAQLQHIEQAHGRERPYRNAPRTLDLDVLLWGNATIDSPTLTVPHPRMYDRAFVLQPLAELAPTKVSAQDLAAVADQAIVRLQGPAWARIAG